MRVEKDGEEGKGEGRLSKVNRNHGSVFVLTRVTNN